MSIRLTQVELQSEEDTVIFLASGHLNCVEQVKPLLEAENFLEDHDGEDIEVSLSHYLYGDEGPAYDADQNHIRLMRTHRTGSASLGIFSCSTPGLWTS